MIGFSQMQRRLLQFKRQHFIDKPNVPFYMASFDISNCFDSIPHDKLKSMLEKLLADKYFTVKRIDTISLDSINDRPKRIISRAAQPLNESSNSQFLSRHSQAVVVDRIVGKVFDGHHIFESLSENIFNNMINVSSRLYFRTYFVDCRSGLQANKRDSSRFIPLQLAL